MLHVTADNLCIEFPIYEQSARSLRHHLVINRLPARNKNTTPVTRPVGATIVEQADGRFVVRAVDQASFTLNEGDRVGIVGHNGAGKTTLLKAIAGIYEPVSGSINMTGRVSPLFNVNEGMDTDSTGIENIWLRCRVLGMMNDEVGQCIDDIAEFTGLGDYLDMPIRTYSSGMLVRLTFAITTALNHDILVMDEMIGAGDAAFVEQAQARLRGFVERSGILVIATHNPGILHEWCNKGMLMQQGRVLMMGSVDEVLAAYGKSVADG